MMHDDNFRSRSQAVRQSARAHLLDIRRARRARRAGLQPASPPLPEASEAMPVTAAEAVLPAAPLPPEPAAAVTLTPEIIAPEPAPSGAFEDAAVQTAAMADLPNEPAPPPVGAVTRPKVKKPARKTLADRPAMPAVAAPQALSLPPGPADIYDDAEVQSAALAELTDPEAALPTDPALPEPTVVVASIEVPVEDREGDLNALPGAGPGLIWMLQQCGITTMRDLAMTDAAELTPKLGLVGQVLNIQTWLDYARSQMPQSG